MKHFLLAFVLLLGVPTLATATEDPPLPEMAAIEQAWARGDFVTVRQGLKRLAEETGTPLAQYRYGRILLEGRGGPRDLEAAKGWLEKAVAQNHAHAATLLAQVFLADDTRDAAKAATLLARTATRGDSEAQYLLAELLAAGDGVDQDLTAAFNWWLAAAEQQHVNAQFKLAQAYFKGQGTEQNTEQTLHWLSEAAAAGHTEAQYTLATALDQGSWVPQNRSAALNWYRRAAEAGLPIAQRILGTRYLQGDEVTPDPDEALKWLESAAAAGDPGAMANLGHAYATGNGLTQDDARAAHWYTEGAQAELGRAMVALGVFHETGRGGMAQDPDRAIALYRQALETADAKMGARALGRLAGLGQLDDKFAPERIIPWAAAAARAGNESAQAWLRAQAKDGQAPAQGYLALILLEQDTPGDEAHTFLQAAAQSGFVLAQIRLGQMLSAGDGFEPDYVLAHKWLNIAAAAGSAEAAELRDTLNALMTPEQIAEAQKAVRLWFAEGEPQPPATDQVIRGGE